MDGYIIVYSDQNFHTFSGKLAIYFTIQYNTTIPVNGKVDYHSMKKPIDIFLDTDIGPDCDDAAALAILLQLCQEGEARLLGITHCTGSPYGLGTIDAICRLFGVKVPLGSCNQPGFLSDETALTYTPSVCAEYPNGFPPESPKPDALEAFCNALENAEKNSVTMVTIGPLNNLARYLTDEHASYLLRRSVSRIISMAGSFDFRKDFAEWNVEMDIPAMQTVNNLWEKELILLPFEAGVFVNSGAPLEKYPDNPVRTAYTLYNKGGFTRPSWDLAAVACAVLEDTGPYEISKPGFLTVNNAGVTAFIPEQGGNRRIIRLKGSPEEAVAWLNTMLERAVLTMTGGPYSSLKPKIIL